jgi:hypothetical protein
MDRYIFQMQPHTLLDGTVADVPVALAEDGRELPETTSLIAAAAIIGAAMNTGDQGTLEDLVDDIEDIVDGDSENGVFIEDELGAGSVSITPEESLIEVRTEGVTAVASGMVYDMLATWNDAKRQQRERTTGKDGRRTKLHRGLGDRALKSHE